MAKITILPTSVEGANQVVWYSREPSSLDIISCQWILFLRERTWVASQFGATLTCCSVCWVSQHWVLPPLPVALSLVVFPFLHFCAFLGLVSAVLLIDYEFIIANTIY